MEKKILFGYDKDAENNYHVTIELTRVINALSVKHTKNHPFMNLNS